jgi:putative acetyltransferase
VNDWQLRASRPEDIDQMYEVWRASVLATHDFLAESDFADICVLVREDYLPNRGFIVAVDDSDQVIGFLGMEGNEIDSLFIAPALRAGAGTEIRGRGGIACDKSRGRGQRAKQAGGRILRGDGLLRDRVHGRGW